MKIYLDDERATPEGWIRAYWPEEVISFLQTGEVEEISLDHDLGDDTHGTGNDVILWIEEQVSTNNFRPPKIKVHSANSAARIKMEDGIASIKKFHLANIKETIRKYKEEGIPLPKAKYTPPRYDEVFWEGVKWLDENG